jgi:[ribosomal protein S5]-alanine N-acetyltransferase
MSYFLAGQRIGLRSLDLADADGAYPEWLNDAEVCAYNSHHVYPYDRAQARAYIESVRGSRSEIVLAVEAIDGKKHIGNVALQSIHPINRSAEFSILLGDRSFWGKGIGEEAGRLLLGHAFHELGLHRVGCGTTRDNEGMKQLAHKLGMREEGCRRAAAWKHGRWVDVLNFGVLVEEFISAEDERAAPAPRT